MHIAHRVAGALCPTRPPRYGFGDYVDIGTGCFGTTDRKFICWEGESYIPQKPSLRVRLHNWLISVGNRQDGDGYYDGIPEGYFVRETLDGEELVPMPGEKFKPLKP